MFRYSAAVYLCAWLKFDQPLVLNFQNHGVTPQSLWTLFKEYKVTRTIPGKGPERLLPFVNALNAAEIPTNRHEAITVVQQISAAMLMAFDASCVSAVSKACWMKFRHPVTIYDRLARIGLERSMGHRIQPNDYGQFYAAWATFFDANQAQIYEASQWLPNSLYAQSLVALGAATAQQIEDWANTDWFRNRITDQRLVAYGNPAIIHAADIAKFIGPGEAP